MIYPDNFEQKIGIDTIRQYVTEKCLGTMGEERVKAMSFSSDFTVVLHRLEQTAEFLRIVKDKEDFPAENFIDMCPCLRRVQQDKTVWLNEQEIMGLGDSLGTVENIVRFFRQAKEKGNPRYPVLSAMAEEVKTFPDLAEKAGRLVDRTGQLKDSASRLLADIRKEKAELKKEVARSMQTALRNAQMSGIISRDTKPNMRDGHMVIPVDAANKRKIKGVIHSGSGSGKTFYIEPEEVVAANRKLQEAESAERRETVKILIGFTELVRPHIDALVATYAYLGDIDFIRAKALFAHRIHAVCPTVEDKPQVQWRQAVHPLLNISLLMQKRKAHPLDIRLDESDRILIVSGANAGGKFLCLKTVALLQYMLQCGLLIPVDERSRAGIFEHILVDIGDGQSIENSLSTYTAHLNNMKLFVEHCNDRSLILIDEFGSGTEPQIGGAIAEALLERFNGKRSFGVITTHFQNLKQLAYATEGLVNGAMLYDAERMQPLYTLAIGIPGSSFATEVARRIGLPEDIIAEASAKLGKEYVDMENHLQQLIHERLREERTNEPIHDGLAKTRL